MGVKSVTLHDPNPAQLEDLGTNFYLEASDVGKPRADAVIAKLSELNQYVAVDAYSGDLTEDFLTKFQVRFS